MTALPRTPLRLVPSDEDSAANAPIGRSMRHALVCLDLAPASEICLAYAQMAAAAFGAEITLTHVMPSAKPGSGVWSRTDVLEWEIERREAQQYLEQASSLLAERVTPRVSTTLTQGTPAERITATATEIGADLTIVASGLRVRSARRARRRHRAACSRDVVGLGPPRARRCIGAAASHRGAARWIAAHRVGAAFGRLARAHVRRRDCPRSRGVGARAHRRSIGAFGRAPRPAAHDAPRA